MDQKEIFEVYHTCQSLATMKLQIGKEIYASNPKTLDKELAKLNFHAFFPTQSETEFVLPKPLVSKVDRLT